MKDMQFTHKWVLVTGASSGLGLEMATQLAEQHQANLILVARREAQLLALKQRLEQNSGIQCHVIAADLSLADDVERVYQQATQLADIYGVILNAGVTHFGEHHELAWPDFEKMLALNVTSVVRLLTLFSQYLKDKNQGGGMMVISSMAGLLPVPFHKTYQNLLIVEQIGFVFTSCFNKIAQRDTLGFRYKTPQMRGFTALSQHHTPLGLTFFPQALRLVELTIGIYSINRMNAPLK